MAPTRESCGTEVGWRAPASNTNAFGREGHLDVMASEAGVDPLEFRLKNLKDQRMKRVLEAAAERFGWKPAPSPSKRGWGVACGDYEGTYVAMTAEVEVDKNTGKIQVKKEKGKWAKGQKEKGGRVKTPSTFSLLTSPSFAYY